MIPIRLTWYSGGTQVVLTWYPFLPTGLGTGGFLYRATMVGSYLLSEDCQDHLSFATAIFGFVFNVLQMAFLIKYSKVSTHAQVLKGEDSHSRDQRSELSQG